MMIEDWEIGQLYWNCLAIYEGNEANEAKAVEDVKKKHFEDFAKTKDLYFFRNFSTSSFDRKKSFHDYRHFSS